MKPPMSRRQAVTSLAGFAGILAVPPLAAATTSAQPASASPATDSFFTLPGAGQTRWATPENPEAVPGQGGKVNGGRKGRPSISIQAGERVVLASASGTSGIVRRFWATIDHRSPAMLRGLKLEIFWDGSEQPAIAAPIADFFGTGLGRLAAFQCAYFSNPEGRSFNTCLPMPFRQGMQIVLTNESPHKLEALYYEISFTVGDVLPPEALYLHAHWRRENPTTLQRDYEILPRVAGAGRFLGCNIGVIADQGRYQRTWWGEGEVKVYLDGDREFPTLCGTGTEDYIGTAWGQGRYDHLYQGCPVADAEKMQYCFYRYHGPDPIWFRQDVRVTIHQIGCWAPDSRWDLSRGSEPLRLAAPGMPAVDWAANDKPYGLFERQDDWSSCAYFYLGTPQNELPALADVARRVAGLAT